MHGKYLSSNMEEQQNQHQEQQQMIQWKRDKVQELGSTAKERYLKYLSWTSYSEQKCVISKK